MNWPKAILGVARLGLSIPWERYVHSSSGGNGSDENTTPPENQGEGGLELPGPPASAIAVAPVLEAASPETAPSSAAPAQSAPVEIPAVAGPINVDYCAPCGPEKHFPVARKLLQEARERFGEDGRLTPDGIGRVRDALMELRTYSDTDLRVIDAEGQEKEWWEDIRAVTTDLAHYLGTGGKNLNLGEGTPEDLDRAIQDIAKLEGLAYEGLIRFGVRKGGSHE